MVLSLNWLLTGYIFHSHQLHFKAATVIKQYNLLLAKKCWCAVARKIKSLAVLGTGGSALYPKLLSSISHNGVNAFFSRVMNSTQRNYCTTRRELLAVISTLQHFRHYLLGNKVVLRTDQHSLYKNTSNIMFLQVSCSSSDTTDCDKALKAQTLEKQPSIYIDVRLTALPSCYPEKSQLLTMT